MRVQTQQCNELIAQAKKALADGDTEECKRKIYQVYHSMPKHKQMLHMFEDANIRKLHEDVEMQMLSEMRKEEGIALRGQLYFTIDERTREVALTDLGCDKMNPQDPKMFVIPDLASAMSEIDGDKTLSEQDRIEKKRDVQANFMEKSQRVHVVDQLLRAYCLYERDVDYVVQDNHVYIVDEFTGRILPGRRWSRALRSRRRARRSPRSRSRTTSVCTRSSPA